MGTKISFCFCKEKFRFHPLGVTVTVMNKKRKPKIEIIMRIELLRILRKWVYIIWFSFTCAATPSPGKLSHKGDASVGGAIGEEKSNFENPGVQ